MLDSFLRHVTKDSYGPISFRDQTAIPAVVHKFQDSFSFLGWGRMPDPIVGRGKVNAYLFSKFNTAIQSPDAWENFLRSPDALAFRKAASSIQQTSLQQASVSPGGSVSATLNELAETFPIRNNFIGAVGEQVFKNLNTKVPVTREELLSAETFLAKNANPKSADQKSLAEKNSDSHATDSPSLSVPNVFPICEYIPEEKIPVSTVMGRAVWDYSIFRNQTGPKILPFEFICHYRLTDASLKRLKIDSISLPKTASLQTLQAGTTWDFPVIELALIQSPFEKRIGLSEALWMTGMSPEALQKAMLTAAWTSAFIRQKIKKVELNAVKIHLAFDANGELVLHDNFTLDDFYLEREGRVLHPDSAIEFYQKTSWIESVHHAKLHAENFGNLDWKRLVAEPAPFLDPKIKARLESDQQELLQCLSE
jgi:phosphoribosylaminoimidazole-succinocarboxamide synthase